MTNKNIDKKRLAPKTMLAPIYETRGKVDLINAFVATKAFDENTIPTINHINDQLDALIEHLKVLDLDVNGDWRNNQ